MGKCGECGQEGLEPNDPHTYEDCMKYKLSKAKELAQLKKDMARARVKIPFYARFKEPLLDGTKTWTSRTKWYGEIGDTFEAFGHEFVITRRFQMTLSRVAIFWREEGCKSREDFVELWKKIHPRKGFDPKWVVNVHVFARVSRES